MNPCTLQEIFNLEDAAISCISNALRMLERAQTMRANASIEPSPIIAKVIASTKATLEIPV